MSEDREETYDPSTVEIDRGRQQGLGMGERDLQGQRDPGDGLEGEGLQPGEEGDDTVDQLGRSARPPGFGSGNASASREKTDK